MSGCHHHSSGEEFVITDNNLPLSPPAPEEMAEIQQLAERYEAGQSLRTIASDIGRSPTYVRRRLLELGVQLRPSGDAGWVRPSVAYHKARGGELRRLREAAGLSLRDAAQVLACHVSKISRIETGDLGVQPQEVRKLLARYGVDDTHGLLTPDLLTGEGYELLEKLGTEDVRIEYAVVVFSEDGPATAEGPFAERPIAAAKARAQGGVMAERRVTSRPGPWLPSILPVDRE